MAEPTTEFESFPAGFLSDQDAGLTDAQRKLLAADQAPPAPGPAPEKAEEHPPVPHPCKRCGWFGSERPGWVRDADKAAIVDGMLFHGRYSRAFRLGPLAVTFRTLYAQEEAFAAAAAASLVTSSFAEQAKSMIDRYKFFVAMAVESLTVGSKTWSNAEEFVSVEQVKKTLEDLDGSYFRAAPVRAAVWRAYEAFGSGVEWVMMESLAAGF